jgi:hypothetical protein
VGAGPAGGEYFVKELRFLPGVSPQGDIIFELSPDFRYLCRAIRKQIQILNDKF